MQARRILRWVVSLALLVLAIKCAQLAMYNTWAASFRQNPNAARYERRANWFVVGAVASLVGVIYFAWPRNAAMSRGSDKD